MPYIISYYIRYALSNYFDNRGGSYYLHLTTEKIEFQNYK